MKHPTEPTFHVHVTSPLGVLFNGRADRVTCLTDKGPTAIFAKHQPSIMIMKPGIIQIQGSEHGNQTKETVIDIEEGTCIIDPDSSVKMVVYGKKKKV